MPPAWHRVRGDVRFRAGVFSEAFALHSLLRVFRLIRLRPYSACISDDAWYSALYGESVMNPMLPHNPTHPGELLLEEFLKPMGVTQITFARHIGVSFKRVNEIVNGKRPVSPDTAWLFSQALGTSPQFWMNLQMTYDLVHQKAGRKIKLLKCAG